jgi:hypothetical protein
MPSFVMLCRVAVVRTDVSEECIASTIKMVTSVEISNLLKLGEEYIYKQNKIRGLYPAR